jgi:hypothetical protein
MDHLTVGDLRKALEGIDGETRLAAALDGDNDAIHSMSLTGWYSQPSGMFGAVFTLHVEVVTEDEREGYDDYGTDPEDPYDVGHVVLPNVPDPE